jgi:hypothetical protein
MEWLARLVLFAIMIRIIETANCRLSSLNDAHLGCELVRGELHSGVLDTLQLDCSVLTGSIRTTKFSCVALIGTLTGMVFSVSNSSR